MTSCATPTATSTKIATLTIEVREPEPTPQTPCPEVHPFPESRADADEGPADEQPPGLHLGGPAELAGRQRVAGRAGDDAQGEHHSPIAGRHELRLLKVAELRASHDERRFEERARPGVDSGADVDDYCPEPDEDPRSGTARSLAGTGSQ